MMDYPAVSIDGAPDELNRLHRDIEMKLRSTVADAIRAGEILTQVKGRLSHGNFLPWVKANCAFSPKTADRYRSLHDHQSKIVTVTNLQEAYKQIEHIEAQEKQTEDQRARKRVLQYLKTGEKPEGWRRGTDDKIADEERARDERIENAKADMESARLRKEEERAQMHSAREADRFATDMLNEAARRVSEQAEKKRALKERMRLSQSGETDHFIGALMDYLEEMESDSRRIEACQNIIKVCRNIAADLQVEK